MEVKKILIIRFSSIGDIVLTTPVVRAIKQQLNCQVHFVTKESFKETLVHNPYIDKLITFKKDVDEVYAELKKENYDIVVDLHKNLRSLRLKQHLKTKNLSFDKINMKKFMAVNFKMIKSLPDKHIVDRYLETVSSLGVKADGKGLDYFITDTEREITKALPADYVVLVVGGSYYTKQIPLNKLNEICTLTNKPIIALGGKGDKPIADQLAKQHTHVINGCGPYTLNQSAAVIEKASVVITSDTGLMHIAAAFNKKIISVWGNTIPEFGMGPYKPVPQSKILEVKNLKCRPCSKLGYKKCPKGHFKCMNQISFEDVEFC